MEKPRVKIELAEENYGNEDPLAKENTIGTTPNTDILMSTPSIRQVCSWISDGTSGNMCVDEILIEEIKIEPSDEYDKSWEPSSKKISITDPDKVVESGQTVSLIGTAPHNQHEKRSAQDSRCKFCSILFFSEKILAKHQKKCQQLFEQTYSAANLEDLQKGMRHSTLPVAASDQIRTSIRSDDVESSKLQSHHATPEYTASVIKVKSLVKHETHSSSSIAIPDSDPLGGDIAPIPPPLVPFSIAAPVLCISVPMSISDTLKTSLPAVVDTAPVPPSLISNPIARDPPPLAPICPAVFSPVSIKLRPTVSSTPRADYESRKQKHVPVLKHTIPSDVTVQMKVTENNVIKTNCRLQESLGVSTDRSILLDSSVLNDFNFEPLDTHHQLEEFDEKLGRDAAFADKMVSWLSRKNEDCDPKTSVVFSLDFLFSRQLFASCSWSGEGRRGPKIPFYKFKNIYKLLRRLASVKGCSESSGLTRDVLVTKLRVAKSRVACKNDSKGFYTKDTRNGRPNNDAPKAANFGVASVNDGSKDSLAKETNTGTSASADITMVKPSVEQVCLLINDKTTDDMCVDKTEMDEIKREYVINDKPRWQPSIEDITTDTTDKVKESSLGSVSRLACPADYQPLQQKNHTVVHHTVPLEIAVQLEQIQNEVTMMRSENCRLQESLVVSTDRSILLDRSALNDFDFEPLDTRNQLEEFDDNLGRDTSFADQMCCWLSSETGVCSPKTSVARSLDLLFSRQLFASCSWSGGGRQAPKIPFYKFKNIHKLLRRLASLKGCKEAADMTGAMLRKRLNQAKARLQFNPGRKAFCKNKSRIKSPSNDVSHFEVAYMKDAPVNQNNTSASADVSMVTSSMEQVCLLTNNYAASNMCIDEIEMGEIKREPPADSDPIWQASSEKITTDTIDKVEESSQSEPSFSAIASHNENRYRRPRCNYCSLLFYSDKTLTNHQKKCQQVYEKLNAAPKMPIAKNEEVGSCSRPENVAADLQPQDFKGACTSQVAKVIANLQAETVPLVSNGDSDPLACDLPPLVPLTISSPVLSYSLKNATVMQYPTSLEITVQLEQLKNAVTKLRSENSQLHESLGVPTDRPILMDRSVLNDFDFEPLDTRNQLEEFDENLGRDAAFADKMGCWLSSETGVCSPKTSIARSIDLLFSRQLFANCSWAGMGQKIPFSKFKNIHKLLRLLSSVKGCKEPTDITRSMLKKRLKQAKARLQINPGRKTFCKNKSRIRSPSNDASHFEVATIIDGTKDSPANQSNTDTSNTDVFTERPILLDRSVLNDFDFEPLDTRNQLEEFDENLGRDAAFADKMGCWLSSETGDCSPKTSIARSIDLLFSRQLFANCSWAGMGQKIPFSKFKNIHKLLRRLSSVKGCKEPTDITRAMLQKRLKQAKARLQINPGRKTFCKNKSRIRSPSNDGEMPILMDRSVLNDFDFEPLDTRNQLEEFDENLGRDTSFADKMCCWLSSETGVCSPKTSVALSLDLLFSRQLFASCSWSGDSRQGPKIPFCKFENIHKLLHRLASVKGCKEAADMTGAMLRKRLNQAKARLQFNPGRKAFCKNKSRIKSPSNDASNDFHFEPLVSCSQLEKFDENLAKDAAFADKMCCWLSSKTGVCSPKKSVARSLDLLFSRQLFASCSWSGDSRQGPKIPFCKFENIHKLLHRLASVMGCKEAADMTGAMLRKRLSQAKARLKINPGRKTYSRKKSPIRSPHNDATHVGNAGTEDSPTNRNNTGTSTSADMSIVTPSMGQVFSLINNDAAGDMIKREQSADSELIWQPSSEKITTDTIDKMEESSQSEPSFSAIASHNENRYRRPRCNYCSLLFFSDKTLTNHQKKCQQVYEKLNAAPKMPIAGNEEVGSSSRPENVAADLQPQNFKGVCTYPRGKVIANLEVEASDPDSDPLECDLASILPPQLVPLPIPSTGLSNSLPTSIQDPLKPHHPTFVNTAPLQPLPSTPIDLIPPPLVLFSSDSPVSIPLQPTVSSSSRVDNHWQQKITIVPQQTIPSDIAVQLERIKNEVAMLKKQNCRLRNSLGVSTADKSKCFDFEPLDTRNQLEEFEANLGRDAAFADELVAWLKNETAQCDAKTSIVRAIDCLFTRQLFANCSWSGHGQLGPKIPFFQLKNIHTLLQRVASTLRYEASAAMVEHALRSRLKHSLGRVNSNPMRKAHCLRGERKSGVKKRNN